MRGGGGGGGRNVAIRSVSCYSTRRVRPFNAGPLHALSKSREPRYNHCCVWRGVVALRCCLWAGLTDDHGRAFRAADVFFCFHALSSSCCFASCGRVLFFCGGGHVALAPIYNKTLYFKYTVFSNHKTCKPGRVCTKTKSRFFLLVRAFVSSGYAEGAAKPCSVRGLRLQ